MSTPIRSAWFRHTLAAGLVLAPLAGLVAPMPVAAQTRPAELDRANLGRAVAALRGIDTMRADFIQTDRQGQAVSGVMTLKRPGRIRFEYQNGVPLLIVSDGKALTMIDYEVRQVQRWPIGNSPLGALLDPKRDIVKYGKLMPTGNPDAISVEVRDPAHPEYGRITLIFVRKPSAPGGLELTHWVALDSQNKRTSVRLSNHRYGLPVSDRTFNFTDPRRSSTPRR